MGSRTRFPLKNLLFQGNLSVDNGSEPLLAEAGLLLPLVDIAMLSDNDEQFPR